MNPFVRFSALPITALVALSGCSTSVADETASDESALEASAVWTESLETSSFQLKVEGAGHVPVGSECAPGFARYSLRPTEHRLVVSVCNGAPLRERTRGIALTAAQEQALVDAARAVTKSDKTTCSDRGARYAKLFFVTRGTDGADRTTTTASDDFACDGDATFVTGIERVIAEAEEIAAATPAPLPLVFAPAAPSTDTVWSDDAKMLFVEVGGSGEMPAGAACVPGAVRYWFTVETNQVSTARCEPTGPMGRYRINGKQMTLAENQRAWLIGALETSLRPAPVARCAPDAPFISGSIQLAAGVTHLDSDQSACAIDADRGVFIRFEAVRRVFDSVLNAAP